MVVLCFGDCNEIMSVVMKCAFDGYGNVAVVVLHLEIAIFSVAIL
jgi:hypothetical protein